MKGTYLALGVGLGLLMSMGNIVEGAANRPEQWKKVDKALAEGLPKSAIEALNPIIDSALADQAYGEAAKAILRKIVLEGNIQGNKPEEKIVRLEAQIAQAPPELKPIFQAVLANWYWHYFQNNRWRFMQRTATAQAPGKDFTTWDLPRLFAEIDQHFQASLSAAESLKKTPVTAFADLLEKGTLPDTYRPTLYDFIAHEALKFYTSAEQAGAKPQDFFEIEADSPALSNAEAFLEWEVPQTDTNAPAYRAFRLYQDLLRFHQNDPDKTAFLDADLGRLAYAHATVVGEQKTERYLAALKRFTDKWADHELAALALHRWATVLRQQGDLVQARELALRGARVYPDSPGGKLCRNLVIEIEAKSATITTERVWNRPWPKINVRYRNLTQVHFRAVPYSWETFLDRRRNRPENLNREERNELLSRNPVHTWSATLPPATNFQEREHAVPVPENLKPGFYFIIASHDPGFGDVENQVTFTDIWVSDLALVVRTRDGKIEGFVLEASSGEPIPQAEVSAWHLDQGGNRVPIPPQTTDQNGMFAISSAGERGYLLRVRHKGRELASRHDYAAYRHENLMPAEQTLFFTDRALYRPGQMVHYKGICVRLHPTADDYTLLPGRTLTVIFSDANGQEIARQKQRCNEYGSFAGTFTAPRDRLMGTMSLRVEDGPQGHAGFNVEEYKRPKFQVTLEPPKIAPRLNDRVQVTGKATAYTGAAVDGASVRYRVVREVRMPYWWGWFRRGFPPHGQGSQEIAHGTTQTRSDGSFQVDFVARPDRSVAETNQPVFIFRVHADVTDSAGETRSDDHTLNVGYTALQARLTAEDWQTRQKPVEVQIRTESLDGEPQVAEGSIKIHRLKAPAQVHRPPLAPEYYRPMRGGDADPDLSNPMEWPLGEVVAEKGFTTDASGQAKFNFPLAAGVYRAVLETQDRFGKRVTGQLPIQVLDPGATKLPINVPHLLAAPAWTVEPGNEFMALWGTGYDTGRAYIEIEHRNKIIKSFWTRPGRTQQQVTQPVTEAMRGGFVLHVTQVRENRAYLESRLVQVPWSNKELDLNWEHFTSKLQPNQKETWTLVIKRPAAANGNQDEAGKALAEMVATLYDASLDAFLPHHWMQRFGFFRQETSAVHAQFENTLKPFQHLRGYWRTPQVPVDLRYRSFPPDVVANWWGYQWAGRARWSRGMAIAGRAGGVEADMSLGVPLAAASPKPAAAAPAEYFAVADTAGGVMEKRAEAQVGQAEAAPKGPDLSQVTARKNLNETAFFYPQLIADEKGVVKIQFTMPEALTEWRFMGFAHDTALRSGYLEGRVVTAKDLMVQPNPPRFVREGDTLEFTVKVSNQTAARQTGSVRLSFQEVASENSADAALGLEAAEQSFDIPAKESRTFAWRIRVPDGLGFVSYKAVGSTGRVSDGEEGYLPVLSRRVLVRESLPLPIRGPATNHYEFARLLQAGQSDTLRHQGYTLQVVSQPAWYAVLALPFLMEYPYECSEQVFNRLYANSLARHIANADPKIRRIFDQWKNTPALDSPLEKNQELKNIALEETPWVRQAKSESEARRNIGLLFDQNRLNYELQRAERKLREMQSPEGAWPWFPGGRANEFITLYITTGYGRLRHLGLDLDVQPAIQALEYLDRWADEYYRRILERGDKQENHLTTTLALYLYGRSFFLQDKPLSPQAREAVDYYLGQAREYWLKLSHRQSQAHLALALQRFGDPDTARAILRSIRERAVTDDELGMFWRDTEQSWWWYRAPIETQAMMIEAFDEVANDAAAVEACRVWLLKQKQTQDWKTTKATADAVYALLLRGVNLLASDALVRVEVGGQNFTPPQAGPEPGKAEPGTGFYEVRFAPAEVKPELGRITLRKIDPGVAWGSAHWQYLEDIAKVPAHEGTPLKLKKALFRKTLTNRGPVLQPVAGGLEVGDELVVRIELRTDRDMEYVHLKDQRGSGTEPVNVLSRYQFQDGLMYYASTRDTASHFFIDYLPKGVYVFEYSTRVQHRGQYQTGVAEIQCMYAPEFNSHSQALPISVQ